MTNETLTPKKFIQVFINGDEKNLPKENGYYYVKKKDQSADKLFYCYYEKGNEHLWMRYTEWYHQPIEQPSEAESKVMGWWCEECKCFVSPYSVTFNETHDSDSGGCGMPVISKPMHVQPDKEQKPSPVQSNTESAEDEQIEHHLNRIKTIQSELNKQDGNLTCRVLLRALNCNYKTTKVELSVKELFEWFETGQHLKQWKEIDTL